MVNACPEVMTPQPPNRPLPVHPVRAGAGSTRAPAHHLRFHRCRPRAFGPATRSFPPPQQAYDDRTPDLPATSPTSTPRGRALHTHHPPRMIHTLCQDRTLDLELRGTECRQLCRPVVILLSTRQRITTGEMMRDRGGMDGQQGARVHYGTGEHDLGDGGVAVIR